MPHQTRLSLRPSPSLVVPARHALADLVKPYGVQASNWELFKGAVFGRDSEAVARDVDGILPDIFPKVVASLVKYQGNKDDAKSGEEVGRMFHELRFEDVGGPRQKAIYQELSRKNGFGQGGIYLDYGALDTSPQFIRMVAEHIHRHGLETLDVHVPHQGKTVTIGESVRLAAEWISVRISRSEIGLLERLPESGISGNAQTLRDGSLSYVHENGEPANLSMPMASIELQGLAYDALLYAASLVGTEEEKTRWRHQAETLRLKTFEWFWMKDRADWAMAIDRDHEGLPRRMTTRTTLPAELLETSIFEKLPVGYDVRTFITPLVKTVFSSDFLTSVGTRMRSLSQANVLPYVDYQGSWSVWPVSTNIIAKGLHRYGYHSLESELALRTLAGASGIAGTFPEFIMVNSDGEVCWPLSENEHGRQDEDVIVATNFPEQNQAWTVSAVLRLLEEPCQEADAEDWRSVLAAEIHSHLLPRDRMVRRRPYKLDRKRAIILERTVKQNGEWPGVIS